MIFETLTAGVITAGSGRGFVVDGAGERLVITAAHCLPFLPPAQSFFEPKERIFGPLLARLGDEPRARCATSFNSKPMPPAPEHRRRRGLWMAYTSQ